MKAAWEKSQQGKNNCHQKYNMSANLQNEGEYGQSKSFIQNKLTIKRKEQSYKFTAAVIHYQADA